MERDILARVVPSRASSMGPTSAIPHGKSLHLKTVRFGWNVPLRGSRAWLSFHRGLASQSIGIGGYGLWGCSIAPTRGSAKVDVKVAALVADNISIRAACLL